MPSNPGTPGPIAQPGAPAGDVAPDQPSGAAAKRDAELAAEVIGYIDAFANTAPVFTRDGKQLVWVSTRDGLAQPYLGKIDGPAQRVVTTTQRISQVLTAPGGKHLLFSSDTGADENWSFFRVGLDGKNLIELTPNKLNRDPMFVPDGRPSQIYFTARSLAEPRSTLYVIPALAAGEAKAIYTDDKPTTLRAVSADGKLALLRQFPSRSENTLLRLDLETGAAATIFPPSGKVGIGEAVLSRDGMRALVATDNGEQLCLLLSLDVANGKQLAKRAFAPTAQVTSIAVAKEGGLVAVTLVNGARSEIHLIDGRSLVERTTVTMPPGSGGATQFSDDGKQLLITWSTPGRPTDIFVVDPRSGKRTPRNEPRPSLPAGFAIDTSTVDVPAHDGGRIPTNVMVARGEQGKKHPTVVLFHGGPASAALIRWNPLTAALIGAGYAVIEPNIRGSSNFGRAFEAADNGPKRDDSYQDAETVSRWAVAQPWVDKDRMVVMGGSWGGLLTLIALTRWPDVWRAGVELYGVVDLRTTLKTTMGSIRQVSYEEIGDADKDAAFLATISPITDIAKLVDPLFVYAGANDPRVPRAESDRIVRAVRAQHVPIEYMVADNEGHSLARRENQIAFYSRMLRFLEQHLK